MQNSSNLPRQNLRSSKKNKEDEEENHREEKGLQEKRSDRMIPSSTRRKQVLVDIRTYRSSHQRWQGQETRISHRSRQRYSIWAIPKFGTFFNNSYASIGFLEI
ncbi:Protein CBG25830 [Caenorhabditis briggsae]|uniref:Uncharacterized protein n=2 Tax=Caenorhabditis briggsae TaxID=6238 RepID=A0AAE9INM4_CAEBR|nr:Protein CBG25830 [Caenorhabditis briggsae]ULT99144.1 hypothetical protein L3Y34_000468 [Caenorhabditis briggsae]CAS00967.1 Protein CBG25830 [Caenorhabditis briggsae]